MKHYFLCHIDDDTNIVHWVIFTPLDDFNVEILEVNLVRKNGDFKSYRRDIHGINAARGIYMKYLDRDFVLANFVTPKNVYRDMVARTVDS